MLVVNVLNIDLRIEGGRTFGGPGRHVITKISRIHNNNDNNNELYLHDHTNTYSIAKAMFRNQNYNIGQLRYFDYTTTREISAI